MTSTPVRIGDNMVDASGWSDFVRAALANDGFCPCHVVGMAGGFTAEDDSWLSVEVREL